MARKLIVEIIGDSRQLERTLGQANRSLNRFQRQSSQTIRGALTGGITGRGVAFASGAFLGGAGITKVLKDAVTASSNLNEQISKSNVVFGKSAQAVEQWSNTTATAIGLASDQALEAASSFGALLKPLGLSGQEAATQSVKLTKLGADLASFYNTSVQDALDAVRSGVIGEAEPLRRYGVLLSETRVQQEALRETGKKHAKDLTAQEKAQARLALIYRDTAQAQGDFARTSGGLANQQRILSAQFRQLEITIGNQLRPTILKLVEAANKWLSNAENQRRVSDAVKQAVKLLVEAFDVLVGVLRRVNEVTGSTAKTVKLLFEAFLLYKGLRLAGALREVAGAYGLVATRANQAATAERREAAAATRRGRLGRLGGTALLLGGGLVGGKAGNILQAAGVGAMVGGPAAPITAIAAAMIQANREIKASSVSFDEFLQHVRQGDTLWKQLGVRVLENMLRTRGETRETRRLASALEAAGLSAGSIAGAIANATDALIRARMEARGLIQDLGSAAQAAAESPRRQAAIARTAAAQRAAAEDPRGRTGARVYPVELRNQWFDTRVGRELQRAALQTIPVQIRALGKIADELRARIAVTKDITRKNNLQTQLMEVLNQQAGLQAQLASDYAAAQEQAAQTAQEAAEKAAARRRAAQFRVLGLGPEGEELVPSAAALRRRLAQVTRALRGTDLTAAVRKQLERLRELFRRYGSNIDAEVRATAKQWLDEIASGMKEGADSIVAKWPKPSATATAKRIMQLLGLDLTPEQFKRLVGLLAKTLGGTPPGRTPDYAGAFAGEGGGAAGAARRGRRPGGEPIGRSQGGQRGEDIPRAGRVGFRMGGGGGGIMVAAGGIVITGPMHFHGVQNLSDLENALTKRHKARSHIRRGAR